MSRGAIRDKIGHALRFAQGFQGSCQEIEATPNLLPNTTVVLPPAVRAVLPSRSALPQLTAVPSAQMPPEVSFLSSLPLGQQREEETFDAQNDDNFRGLAKVAAKEDGSASLSNDLM